MHESSYDPEQRERDPEYDAFCVFHRFEKPTLEHYNWAIWTIADNLRFIHSAMKDGRDLLSFDIFTSPERAVQLIELALWDEGLKTALIYAEDTEILLRAFPRQWRDLRVAVLTELELLKNSCKTAQRLIDPNAPLSLSWEVVEDDAHRMARFMKPQFDEYVSLAGDRLLLLAARVWAQFVADYELFAAAVCDNADPPALIAPPCKLITSNSPNVQLAEIICKTEKAEPLEGPQKVDRRKRLWQEFCNALPQGSPRPNLRLAVLEASRIRRREKRKGGE